MGLARNWTIWWNEDVGAYEVTWTRDDGETCSFRTPRMETALDWLEGWAG